MTVSQYITINSVSLHPYLTCIICRLCSSWWIDTLCTVLCHTVDICCPTVDECCTLTTICLSSVDTYLVDFRIKVLCICEPVSSENCKHICLFIRGHLPYGFVDKSVVYLWICVLWNVTMNPKRDSGGYSLSAVLDAGLSLGSISGQLHGRYHRRRSSTTSVPLMRHTTPEARNRRWGSCWMEGFS